jgi:AraC-like DNA-binding protein
MLLTRLLREGDCTQKRVSAELRMHPRTMQRRLREEGDTFESIKDSVRREAALHYLSQRQVPFVQVAAALGYWEVSTLSRSCYRWFSASPRRLRKALANGETLVTKVSKQH